MELIIFLIIAIISVVSAFLVVTQRNVIYSALFLILTLCGLAVLYVLLNAPFLAAIQIIVYAGAVMVLFLFVMMLLNLKRDEFGKDRKRIQKSLGILFAILFLVEIAISIKLGISRDFLGGAAPALEKGFGGPHLLGELLLPNIFCPLSLPRFYF